jgi:hypothetical protein
LRGEGRRDGGAEAGRAHESPCAASPPFAATTGLLEGPSVSCPLLRLIIRGAGRVEFSKNGACEIPGFPSTRFRAGRAR